MTFFLKQAELESIYSLRNTYPVPIEKPILILSEELVELRIKKSLGKLLSRMNLSIKNAKYPNY